MERTKNRNAKNLFYWFSPFIGGAIVLLCLLFFDTVAYQGPILDNDFGGAVWGLFWIIGIPLFLVLPVLFGYALLIAMKRVKAPLRLLYWTVWGMWLPFVLASFYYWYDTARIDSSGIFLLFLYPWGMCLPIVTAATKTYFREAEHDSLRRNQEIVGYGWRIFFSALWCGFLFDFWNLRGIVRQESWDFSNYPAWFGSHFELVMLGFAGLCAVAAVGPWLRFRRHWVWYAVYCLLLMVFLIGLAFFHGVYRQYLYPDGPKSFFLWLFF